MTGASRGIVVASILSQGPAQMRLAQHDDVVHALATDRADQPLGKRILPRRVRCMGLSRMPLARNRRVTATQ
jgi:hypothetical protein